MKKYHRIGIKIKFYKYLCLRLINNNKYKINYKKDEVNNKNYDILEMIKRERQDQQEKIDRNFVEKGWTTVKVKNPLNIYE